MTDEKRAFEMTIDLDAPVEDVWAALTKAEELVRWFPLDASVTPGEGGSMHWSWAGAWDWDTRIDIWDPLHRLRLVQERAQPSDVEGRAVSRSDAAPVTLAVDFQLATHEGKTRLRLVHSGFGHGASWDEEIDSISSGWHVELRGLRHYLQRHRGRDRHVGWVHFATDLSEADAWARLLGPQGFAISKGSGDGSGSEALEAGRPYALELATGNRFSGEMEFYLRDHDLCGTVRELNDGIFRIDTFRKDGQTGVFVWLAAYTADAAATVAAFQTRAEEALHRLFPAKVSAAR
jgi:uncharacterized protein YndB with AHSA1/START domain